MVNITKELFIKDPMEKAFPCVICGKKTLYGFRIGTSSYNCCRKGNCEERVLDALIHPILFGKSLLKKDKDNWRPTKNLTHFDLVKFNINQIGWEVSFVQEDDAWVCSLGKDISDFVIYSYDDTMLVAGCRCFLILHDYLADKKKGGHFYDQDGD